MKIVVFGLTAVLLASASQGQGRFAAAGVTDEASVIRFLTQLQGTIARGDRHAVAALVHFPIVATIDQLRVPIADASTFVERYDLLFTSELKNAIAQASASPDAPSSLLATPEGLVIGRNLVVIRPIGGSLKITALTVPTPSSTATRRGSVEAPERISVRAGPNPTQMSGSLASSATGAYLLRASRGQLIEVRIDGVPGREVVARLFDSASGEALDARAKEGVRAWSGRAPKDGDYRIDVVRTTAGPSPLPYTLSVRVR
ncbi:MAG: hypothetical protein LC791_01700 [Acidobacteria bacterium]|nr:hypothetical protein [Acidobacteriota bacterium]